MDPGRDPGRARARPPNTNSGMPTGEKVEYGPYPFHLWPKTPQPVPPPVNETMNAQMKNDAATITARLQTDPNALPYVKAALS